MTTACTPHTLVDFIAPTDALLRDAQLDYETVHTVLGIPTRMRSNSRRVLSMFDDAFATDATAIGSASGTHRDGASVLQPSLTVQVVVHAGHGSARDARDVWHICPDAHRLIVHGPGGFAISDPARHEAIIYATDALVSDARHFRNAFLEAITLALATHFDRQPFHAAAITVNGRLILLFGPSGAGKSTLAYQARELGGAVVSEDTLWLQLEPSPTVWGRCEALHMLPGSQVHFPALLDRDAEVQPTGKVKISVPVERGIPTEIATKLRPVLCLLDAHGERGARAHLERLDAPELLDALEYDAAPGFDRYPERRARCARLLAADGGWRMHLSSDPRDALPLLLKLASDDWG